MRTMIMMGCLGFLLSVSSIVSAQDLWGPDRNVVVNGELITGLALMQLDALNEEFIPPGEYWINYDTGAWGYKGGPAQGIIGQQTQSQNQDNRSYDEVRDDFCINNPGICP